MTDQIQKNKFGNNYKSDNDLTVNNITKVYEGTSYRNLYSTTAEVVNIISSTFREKTESSNEFIPPPVIQEKIDHNTIVKYNGLIKMYVELNGVIFDIYNTLEAQGSPKKNNTIRHIKTLYEEVIGELQHEHKLDKTTLAKKFSDEIIERIYNELFLEVKNSSNFKNNTDLKDAIYLILVDSFINCNILERPPTL